MNTVLKKGLSTIKKFDPVSHGLKPGFLLTNYCDLKGCGCKVPQAKLYDYLKSVGDGSIGKETPDCSVVDIPNSNFATVSTCDFFYPLVDDPYNQGKIACCNVLSDLYAMGMTRVDTILMILGVSQRMTEEEREITTRLMMQGFNDVAELAGTKVTGGQTVFNPNVMIGGTAMATVDKSEIIYPNNAEPGDVLVLTKPLGMQLAVNFNQWFKEEKYKERWLKIADKISEKDLIEAYEKAVMYMSTLNLTGAKLMQKYKASAATDITGFGILGHSKNLAGAQKRKVDLKIKTLPMLNHIYKLDKIARDFRLTEGYAAETSGGLLVILKKEVVQNYLDDFEKTMNQKAWVIGEVVEGDNKAYIVPDFETIEV